MPFKLPLISSNPDIISTNGRKQMVIAWEYVGGEELVIKPLHGKRSAKNEDVKLLHQVFWENWQMIFERPSRTKARVFHSYNFLNNN